LERFYNILEYGEDNIDNSLVNYSVQNEQIDQNLCSLSIILRELENELFNKKKWNEINVAPLRRYIEEWIERELKLVADERKYAVATIPLVIDNNNKKASTNK
jgi:hypothetical protein